jgi:hypothetical protein
VATLATIPVAAALLAACGNSPGLGAKGTQYDRLS